MKDISQSFNKKNNARKSKVRGIKNLAIMGLLALAIGASYSLYMGIKKFERSQEITHVPTQTGAVSVEQEDDTKEDDIFDFTKVEDETKIEIEDIIEEKETIVIEAKNNYEELLEEEELITDFIDEDMCVFGYIDEEINTFINGFDGNNLYQIREKTKNYWSTPEILTLRVLCISDITYNKKEYQEMKKFISFFKNKDNGDDSVARKFINDIIKDSGDISYIEITREYANTNAISYNGCMINSKEETKKILQQHNITINDEQIPNNCVIRGDFSLYDFHKNIPIYGYFKNLFQWYEVYEEGKYKPPYSKWYSQLSYDEGIDTFFSYVQDKPFELKDRTGIPAINGYIINYIGNLLSKKKYINMFFE